MRRLVLGLALTLLLAAGCGPSKAEQCDQLRDQRLRNMLIAAVEEDPSEVVDAGLAAMDAEEEARALGCDWALD
jgi:cytochrome c-type biogenesis protein CcmH/NrfG